MAQRNFRFFLLLERVQTLSRYLDPPAGKGNLKKTKTEKAGNVLDVKKVLKSKSYEKVSKL